MNDYFKPLRRKIGVLTLVVACQFMGWWARSTAKTDSFMLGSHWVQLQDGYIVWQSSSRIGFGPDWKTIYIPYWSFVVPLTLLSAYLLLSKPCQPKPIPPATEATRCPPTSKRCGEKSAS